MSKPIDMPPEVARRFVADMLAYFAEPSSIKRDEISARQVYALREFQGSREKPLRIVDVIDMFVAMRDQA